MRTIPAALFVAALFSGCVHAEPRPAKPIPDAEPDVTRQVSTLLGQARQGALAREQLTSNASASIDTKALDQISALLRKCPSVADLALLSRTTMGEERQYLYRAACGSTPLLVAISFGKGAMVSRFSVREERMQ